VAKYFVFVRHYLGGVYLAGFSRLNGPWMDLSSVMNGTGRRKAIQIYAAV